MDHNVDSHSLCMQRLELESRENWKGVRDKIPYIRFDSNWDIKIIPPFAGATVRFVVKCGENTVSVYLDHFSRLGACDTPYWEVYPYKEDVGRCDIDDVDALLKMIRESFAEPQS